MRHTTMQKFKAYSDDCSFVRGLKYQWVTECVGIKLPTCLTPYAKLSVANPLAHMGFISKDSLIAVGKMLF
jgi:hypothetical protein